MINDLLTTLDFDANHNLLVTTQHNQGFMTTKLDEYSQAFVNYAGQRSDWTLEIGAAYGVATLTALQKGAKVIANDLYKIHLDVLHARCPKKLLPNLKLLSCDINNAIFAPQSIAAVLACRVLHFMDGETLIKILNKIYIALKPDGKFFVVVDTPFMGWWKKCINVFNERKIEQVRWPGIFQPANDFCSETIAKSVIPPLVHWFDQETISLEMQNIGFNIDKISYIDRANCYPETCCLDGRESIGLIATKL